MSARILLAPGTKTSGSLLILPNDAASQIVKPVVLGLDGKPFVKREAGVLLVASEQELARYGGSGFGVQAGEPSLRSRLLLGG